MSLIDNIINQDIDRERSESPHVTIIRGTRPTDLLSEIKRQWQVLVAEWDKMYPANRVKKDKSFGGALRRLRLSRGLSRADFSGITEKEIARIERGEVKRPRRPTMSVLAKRLGVGVDEIATY